MTQPGYGYHGDGTPTHQDGCLMCAVRALTEGDPPAWAPKEAGETVSGVVLKVGILTTDFGQVPYVDLWQGGHQRVRVKAFGVTLRHALDSAAPQVGDMLSVWYDGEVDVAGRRGPMVVKKYTANVQRGHGA